MPLPVFSLSFRENTFVFLYSDQAKQEKGDTIILKTFYDFQLQPEVMRAIEALGYTEPTPIQAQAIQVILDGQDIIGQAQTGTGKTAAFGIPLVNGIDQSERHISAVILTPTRELAIQVAGELEKLSRYKGLRVLAIYGGQDIEKQIRLLKEKPQIIVGTPGRMLDHIRRKTVRLQHVRTVVLDEADEMLDMGFMDDIKAILESVPEERHTLLFSATMPPNIKALAERFLKNPKHISVLPKQPAVRLIDQYYSEVRERQKFEALRRILDAENPELAIVFGRTKRRVDELTEALQKSGYAADGLHGDLSQKQRDTVMRKFRDKAIQVLVATDVAARGLDVSGVTHVINFDIPQDPESYVHRIGRTGRAGNSGAAWTFVTPGETEHLQLIAKITRHHISKRRFPSRAEAEAGKHKVIIDRIVQAMENDDLSGFQDLSARLLRQYDSAQLLAAAIKLLLGEQTAEFIELTPEEPMQKKKRKTHHAKGERKVVTRKVVGESRYRRK
jgi:ATP-dependent RNA helicase DeaD